MSGGLSPDQIDRFRADGFLGVPSFSGSTNLAAVRDAYDELIDQAVSAAGDRMLGGITRQVMVPSQAHPLFDRNELVERAQKLGEQLTGTAMSRGFDMLIYKPPGHPHETPWHQDMAYSETPMAPAGTPLTGGVLQFWITLDAVNTDTGCMQFIPGHHRGVLLEHEVMSEDPQDPGRLLGLREPREQLDLSRAVAIPLPPGGCTIHNYGTPHYTGPNLTTDRPRRAYILNFVPA